MFSSYIDFVLDFSWTFRKKSGEIFNGISMCRLWHNVVFLYWFSSSLFMKPQQKNGTNLLWHFNAKTMMQRLVFTFNLFLTFHEASVKNWKKSLMAFQCPDCNTTFGSYIIFFPDFSWSFSKKGRNLWCHFNAQPVTQTFGYYIDLVLDF